MRLSVLFLTAVIIISGCLPSEKNSDNMPSFENLVEVTPPDNTQEESTLYIDSVQAVNHNGNKALLIQGSFPDGCTKLESANHTGNGETMAVNLKAWRNPEMICTQALTAFSFIYDKIDPQKLSDITSVEVNGKNYPLQ